MNALHRSRQAAQADIRSALRRRALGLTQAEAAQLLGMQRLTYHRIETGARHISFAEGRDLRGFPLPDRGPGAGRPARRRLRRLRQGNPRRQLWLHARPGFGGVQVSRQPVCTVCVKRDDRARSRLVSGGSLAAIS